MKEEWMDIKTLNRVLISETSNFTWKDYFRYRENRNWREYDVATQWDRLKMILKEVRLYKRFYK